MAETFYTFGVQKLEIAPVPTVAGTDPTWVHVPSVEAANVKLKNAKESVFGDDRLQYVFYHTPEGEIEVKLTKVSPEAVEVLTGNQTTISGTTETEYLGTQKDLAPKQVLVRVTIPARRDGTGESALVRLIALKVTFQSLWDSGMNAERGKATELTWVGTLQASTKDEKGNNLPAGIDYAYVKRVLEPVA